MKHSNIILPILACAALLAGAPRSFAQSDGLHILTPAEARGKHILFVCGEAEKDHPNDDLLVKKHLEDQGYIVTVGKEDDEAIGSGEDLIVISSTADPREVAAKYAASSIPVFTWNTVDYPDMHLSGPERHIDFETVEPDQDYARAFSMLYGYYTNATTPILKEMGIPRAEMFGTLYLLPQTFGWAKPAASADIIVSLEGDPTRAGVFTYEKGSSLYGGFVAPSRRVGFYLRNANFHYLTQVNGPAAKDPDLAEWWTGLTLFDTSIRWALSAPQTPMNYDPGALKTRLGSLIKGKKIAFIRRLDTPEGEESDDHIVAHLKDLGASVQEIDQSEPQSVANGADAIIVSATDSKYKMSNKYRDAKVPVFVLEGLMADTMKFSNRHRYVDYGEHGEAKESEDPQEQYLEIINSSSVMAAGLRPGYVKYIKEPDVLKWATPTASAIAIATLPNSRREVAIFGYEKGASMADEYIAPARRALLPVDNPQFDDLTKQGHALFDAVLLWVISPPESAR